MNRSILALAILFAAVPMTASADDKPTPAQIEKAKKAFAEGKQYFEKGDFPEAVAKFKESYNLSKNPVLLYNIGFANESAGMDDIALFYYRKFLTDAPAEAAQRAEVTDRVKALEKKFQTGGAAAPATTEPAKTEPPKAEPVKIKPAGTYGEADFQHQSVDAAPPGQPLDVTAFVPEDSGFEVTLFFRSAGEAKFTSKPMKWRYKELVGRIPAGKMAGDSIQYYVEVKDQSGAVVTRAGKSTSPNLITIESGATARFYPDFEDGDAAGTATEPRKARQERDEDPLNRTAQRDAEPDTIEVQPEQAIGGNGFRDVGSSKFTYMKWGSTAGAGVLLGASVFLYLQAGKQATALEEDSTMCGVPPCRKFDPYDQDLESAGQRNQTLSRITLTLGVGAAAVAGYYWYKELTAKRNGELKVSGKGGSPDESSWSFAPSIGEGFTGAAAAARF